ncbi:hypothetical protein BEWA_022730 [Theileria equi strain WA]|uniref:Uncharacterized protein n=1 Tax=Theileria equi strain WA TaxID=1537102 RepID=L0AV64_THEEQ|nr:hypothetical protein BEWA_022730 [Theileria equi strain WA]AFZ79425.1 hypothetical protein BEWA_022730 [Theileria equi strain WA]|eukprot:XP_004829091.1 hypothetical protein BEWA_022730 [Theileria equi strain WA]
MTNSLPTVTIDIQRSPSNGEGPDTYGNSPNQVSLRREESPPGSGFWKFKHQSHGGQAFHVKEVVSGATPVSDLNQSENIEHLAVWYYSGDSYMDKPLLIEIGKKDGKYEYHETKGTGWTSFGGSSQSQLKGEDLERKLEYLNCQYHKLVTVNLSHDNSQTHFNDRTKYCCDKDHKDGYKVTVTSGKVGKGTSDSQEIPYFKHEVDPGISVAGIYYTVGGERKRIKIPNLENSGNGSVKFYTFYSNNGSKEPRLIYVDCSSGKGNVTGWYEPNPTGGDNQPWEKLQGVLQGKHPSDIKAGKDENYSQYIEALNCKIYGQCTEPTESSSPVPGPAGLPGTTTSSITSVSSAVVQPGAPADQTSEEPALEETPKPEKLFGFIPASMAGYVFPSVFGGSGAVGLAGYKLLKNSRDPWVRQI